MPSKTLKTTIVKDGSMCFIPLTFDPKAVFGKLRASVKVTLNGYTYRSTIAAMGGPPWVSGSHVMLAGSTILSPSQWAAGDMLLGEPLDGAGNRGTGKWVQQAQVRDLRRFRPCARAFPSVACAAPLVWFAAAACLPLRGRV
jgi:Domain of unknown function (DUF1905)